MTKTRNFPTNRESWLTAVTDEVLRPWFAEVGLVLPPRIRFGVGWSHAGFRTNIVAECYVPSVSGDGATEVIIGTNYHELVRILDAVIHELIHAALPEHGHDKVFAAACKALGLVGPATSTVAGEELTEILRTFPRRFGPYPHAGINLSGASGSAGAPGAGGGAGTGRYFHEKPKQSTRMKKCVCLNIDCETVGDGEVEGYICRTTAKWIEQHGAPICPSCHEQMTVQN